MRGKITDFCNKQRTIIIESFTKELTDEKGKVKSYVGKSFLFFHFFVGFLFLWLTYFQVGQILEMYAHNGDNFLLTSFIETLYLIGGVVWGNVGWDYHSKIKNGATASEIIGFLLEFPAFFMFAMPLIIATFKVLYSSFYDGFEMGYYFLASSSVWMVCIFGIIVTFILKKINSKKVMVN
jgi:hypothetical protein